MAGHVALVLDTTYILPAFGVDVNVSPSFEDEMATLWEDGIPDHDIYLPAVCIIEACYKVIKEYKHSSDERILDRYTSALPPFLGSSPVTIVHPYLDVAASDIAMKLRHAGHEDMMDCWIAGCAASYHAILVTEDDVLKEKLKNLPATREIVCQTWVELQRSIQLPTDSENDSVM
jgi:predicted nucleic acid-binding protein